MSYEFLWLITGCGVAALVYLFFLFNRIKKQNVTDPKVSEIQGYIKEGAMAFIKREYKILAIFFGTITVLIALFLNTENVKLSGLSTAISFLVGGLFSGLAGYIGMRAAVAANGRATQAAKDKGMSGALGIAFGGGNIMGMAVAGLAIIGLSVLMYIFYAIYKDIVVVANIVTGYSFGASTVALFARVGGGIYTKAADVGADLVGKVEAGIPEDDPRNPAVIADNVGDNVGDVAGMGSDLFESFIGSLVAAIALGTITTIKEASTAASVLFPLIIAGGGVLSCIVGALFVRGESKNPHATLKIGTYVSTSLSAAIAIIAGALIFKTILPSLAVVVGIAVGIAIGQVTELYTSDKFKYVKHIRKASDTGAATNILAGFSVGMISTALPALVICAGILLAYLSAGIYGIALAAVGMLATVAMTIAVDAYGPIADNAGGIAEMSGMGKEVREITDKLDSVGNTTAAIGKGFCVGSAALTTLALFVTLITTFNHSLPNVDITTMLNLSEPLLIVGLLLGGMLPFLFSALTVMSVEKAAGKMIEEVRRQFREDGILEGNNKPDYAKCVDISTKSALKEMILPGVLAILAPVLCGIFLGYKGLAGLLAGALASGLMMAVFMGNSGGAWDNTKKLIESENKKGSPEHGAAVVGDTVGDPFKDTAGPSIDILIKLMTVVSVVLIPLFILIKDGTGLLG